MNTFRMIFQKMIIRVVFTVAFLSLGIQLQCLYAQDNAVSGLADASDTGIGEQGSTGDTMATMETMEDVDQNAAVADDPLPADKKININFINVPMEPINNEPPLTKKYEMAPIQTKVEEHPAAYIYTEYNESMDVPLNDGRKVTLSSSNGDEDIVAMEALKQDRPKDDSGIEAYKTQYSHGAPDDSGMIKEPAEYSIKPGKDRELMPLDPANPEDKGAIGHYFGESETEDLTK